MVSQFENDNGSGSAAYDGAELDTLPHSWEAEQALLGALLYDNEIYHRVSGIVQAKHFYNPVNGRIFEQTSKLIELGQLADAIVLKVRREHSRQSYWGRRKQTLLIGRSG